MYITISLFYNSLTHKYSFVNICIHINAEYRIQYIRGENMFIATLDAVKVGNTIAFFRKQKGISQEVLSGLADIGRSHLSAIERGERKPTLETLYRICTALDIKMSTLILKLEETL